MLLTTGLKESGTELGQFAAETTNKRLAQGANIMEATWDGFVSMGTDEGIEAALQGFVGGSGIAGGGRIVSRALRNDTNGQKFVAASLRDLSKLNTKRGFAKKGSAEMDALDIEIKTVEDNLRTYLLDNQKMMFEIKTTDLKTVLNLSDFITFHIPKNQKKAFIGKKEFKMMKNGVFIVNAARGGVIDESELITALETGIGWHIGISRWVHLAAFIPEVFATENKSPFFKFPSSAVSRVSFFINIFPLTMAILSVMPLVEVSTI